MADIFDEVEAAYQELLSRTQALEAKLAEQETKLRTHDYILQHNSKSLTDFTWETVFKSVETVPASGSGGSKICDAFDITQQSKDSSGNVVIPQAFYLISAFTTDSAIDIIYSGSALTVGHIFVSIKRTASTNPLRIESNVVLNNTHALAHNVHIEVLKLLGRR